MRVLVVEDQEDLANALRSGLARAGYAVDTAVTGSAAAERLAVTAYDLLVLDISLPDTDGLTLCAGIRSGSLPTAAGRDLRVLMLTARTALADRVRGLDTGADDYLTKPFALAELLARVRALLRRDAGGGSAVVTVGPLVLDGSRHRVLRDGKEVALTLKEFGVLRYLMSRPGHVVSAEELLEHVWDENTDPFTETVRVTVGTLRRKITPPGAERPAIETVIGRGYRLPAAPPVP
ncbi:response regulator transcription factor [Streptomyces aidingensis]|uniref:DNA-binding response regulator, OmpR family, contains REC and winged-helix (WHTH) domain n=1 Tax=Streptomyces aidingensis TaxID=910347 RepID=A0A1I1UFJ4_9ACTN|nr:response regulator transcription factor [Streptomyces aidingensis]SFD69616.1 DNA-binding response regulator, OmpR family, contains REC and winged-helix (wHTH) domain [Streptomyces aidingensis]